jgi:DNA-binding MarR family transcriptional regulator
MLDVLPSHHDSPSQSRRHGHRRTYSSWVGFIHHGRHLRRRGKGGGFAVMLVHSSNFPALIAAITPDGGVEKQRACAVIEIIRSAEEAQQLLRTRIGKAGLTVEGLQTLASIASDQNTTPGGLARQLRLSRATVSYLLSRLEVSGLISRSRDPSNRRRVRVSLTPAGRNTLGRAAKACTSGLAQIAASMNDSGVSTSELHSPNCKNLSAGKLSAPVSG